MKVVSDLPAKYPPSEPCSCLTCKGYCTRPGWWTVSEAEKAVASGLSWRMMLEISPDRSFSVLSPAFKGNECNYAFGIFSGEGCTFLSNGLCELYGTGLQPLECRYCHHDRTGEGQKCHDDIGNEWNTPRGKKLVVKWGNLTGFWQRQGFILKEK